MILTEGLTRRLIASDAACVGARLGVIARRPGNPFGAAIRRDGDVHAFRCRGIPTVSFNRVVGLTEAEASAIPDYTDWLREAVPHGRIELLASRHGPALGATLARAGWIQTGFSAVLAAEPCQTEPTTPVVIEQVRTELEMDVFLATHLHGWGVPVEHHAGARENMRQWLGLPGWTMLLARIDGEPAGSAVVHIADGLAYCADAATHPAWRGRGVQAALLHRRRRLAAEAGTDLVWSGAAFPSTSCRNMLRAGFSLLGNVALWTAGGVPRNPPE